MSVSFVKRSNLSHDNPKHLCPICKKFEFEEWASFDNCTVCGWEDDALQYEDQDYAGGANRLSANQYREKWLAGEIEPPEQDEEE